MMVILLKSRLKIHQFADNLVVVNDRNLPGLKSRLDKSLQYRQDSTSMIKILLC